MLTLAHRLSVRKKHVKCLSVAPLSSKASLEKTEAMAAKNPAVTARENPTPNIPQPLYTTHAHPNTTWIRTTAQPDPGTEMDKANATSTS